MSVAGILSTSGDAYQALVALDWVVRMLESSDVQWVEVEAVSIPGEGDTESIQVDDVVIQQNETRMHVQAKKHQPDHKPWTVRHPKLAPELVKARDQLEASPAARVRLYSQSSFGELDTLIERARAVERWDLLAEAAGSRHDATLRAVAEVMERTPEEAFDLVLRLEAEWTRPYGVWYSDVVDRLGRRFARPKDVAELLLSQIAARGARLTTGRARLTRDAVVAELRRRHHVEVPSLSEAEMLKAFRRASRRGRDWPRTVGGISFERPAVGTVIETLKGGASSVVVQSPRGGGKTCVLLDVVDRLEVDDSWSVLFVRGDWFADVDSPERLAVQGLPKDVVGVAAGLAMTRRVAVVIDALDVLSLQGSSSALSVLLGLADELIGLDGVSVVAACRDFDLEYAVELRGRSWDRHVAVGLLPEPEVEAALAAWGVDPAGLGERLRALLRVPEHLRLYHALVERGVREVAATPYALHDAFLSEVVERDDALGAQAMTALEAAAEWMQSKKSTQIPASALPGGTPVADRLQSSGVLQQGRAGHLEFTHQELLDVVVVRAAVRSGTTLREFLTSRPPLPFIRPTARTFFFMVRAGDGAVFRREVRDVLGAEDVAHHLRRLVAESLAEIEPTDADAPLWRAVWRQQPELFVRFLRRLKAPVWFDVVTSWLEEARRGQDADVWTVRFLNVLETWLKDRHNDVLDLWVRGLREGWPGVREVAWQAAEATVTVLKATKSGRPPEAAGELIRLLVDVEDDDEYDSLGHLVAEAVRLWVGAVDADDDLVWRVLQFRGPRESRTWGWFHNGWAATLTAPFLAERLSRSDELIGHVVDAFTQEAEEAPRFTKGTLESTSWAATHTVGLGATDDIADLATPLETAISARARVGGTWWVSNEAALRSHPDYGVRYLVLRAYLDDPARHAAGAAVLLADPLFDGLGWLDHKVHTLTRAVYPHLDDDQREAHQRAVLGRIDPDESDARRRTGQAHAAYANLRWVPALWRTAEAAAHLEAWRERFGLPRSSETIHSGAGWVRAPFGTDELLAVSDEGIFGLIKHYGTHAGSETNAQGHMVGGWDDVARLFETAAQIAPWRMLDLAERMVAGGAPPPYPDAIVGGVGRRLQVRAGRLGGDGPVPQGPEVSVERLARRALRLVEVHGDQGFREGYYGTPPTIKDGRWLSEHSASEVLQGCARVLTDVEGAARQALLLTRLAVQTREVVHQNSAATDALNTIAGEVAGCTSDLVGQLVEAGLPVPDMLDALWTRMAASESAGARHAVVSALPWIAYHDEARGWAGAALALADPDPEVWKEAERLFGYATRDGFERVAPYLDRMRELVPETYGRIVAFCALFGHLDMEGVVDGLSNAEPEEWKGMVQVLTANLKGSRLSERCKDGLVRLVGIGSLPDEAAKALDNGIGRAPDGTVPARVVEALIERTEEEADEPWTRWRHVVTWVRAEAERDPAGAVPTLERLAAIALRTRGRGFHGSREPLGRALAAVLRDADQGGDAACIGRVIALQDAFGRSGAVDVDAMMDRAART